MEPYSFNIYNIIEHFENCLIQDSDVALISYVNAYEELNRLFAIFGKVFRFVELDVANKHNILKGLHNKSQKNYETVEKMILFELYDSSNVTLKLKQPKGNGSRTLLRLHRAMAFLIKFIEKIRESSSESVVSDFQNAYQSTLANYHSWILKKSVDFAAHTIPNKIYLFNAIFGVKSMPNEKEIQLFSERFLKILTSVYDRIQKIYADKNLLDLP